LNVIEALLWDNDGVLLDTETLFFETTRMAFDRLGLTLTKELWGRYYLGEGWSSRELAAFLGGDAERTAAILTERNLEYRQILSQAPPLRPRVRETLGALHGRVRMAIVTGSHRDQLELMHGSSGLLDLFEVIITGDECAHSKPHPEPYLTALKLLEMSPRHCVAVEDSPRGLASARAAGVSCMVVPHELTHALAFTGALSVEQDVSGILKYVRRTSTSG
jgi:HAD superfamily hydrolase (TIGR01509 family)